MHNKANEFRALLAENGIEVTPDQAKKIYKMTARLRKLARKMSTVDLWRIEEDDSIGMPREERQQIADLYRAAKEI
jgi:hypothetical protein